MYCKINLDNFKIACRYYYLLSINYLFESKIKYLYTYPPKIFNV